MLLTRFCYQNTASALRNCIDDLAEKGALTVLILACEADGWTPELLNAMLKTVKVSIAGGIFPNIIHEHEVRESGTAIIGIPQRLDIAVLRNLSEKESRVHAAVHKQGKIFGPSDSLLIFVDGLAQHIERLVSSLYTVAGSSVNAVGAGAGHSDMVQRPCVFTNQGLLDDAAIIVKLPFKTYTGIKHGWQLLQGPYSVTKSKGNSLKALNYEHAYGVYRTQVEAACGRKLLDNNFFDITRNYPLGVQDAHGRQIVRDPIRMEGRDLVCLGGVPENAMVYILQGDSEKLIRSAAGAANKACTSFYKHNNTAIEGMMVFDCISRKMLLGENFVHELNAIKEVSQTNGLGFGALTISEIANGSNAPINLLNKSVVVSVF